MYKIVVNIFLLSLFVSTLIAQDSTTAKQDSVYRPLIISLSEKFPGVRSGLCGDQLSSPISVTVLDSRGNPVSGEQVAFDIIGQPDQSSGAEIIQPLAITDSSTWTKKSHRK